MIDAVIFDFDGVILDSETPNYTTWQAVFESHGVELDRGLWSSFIGGGAGRLDVCGHLEELAGGPLDCETIRRERRQRYIDIIESGPLLPGVLEYILDAKRLGLKLGIASSSSRDWVDGHLARRGLLGHFECIRGRDDVSSVKPDPQLYVSAVAGLGTSPDRALAIEDSPNGVTAAKRAGLLCVVVPNEMTEGLPTDHADLRLGSLSDVGIESLLARLAGDAGRAEPARP